MKYFKDLSDLVGMWMKYWKDLSDLHKPVSPDRGETGLCSSVVRSDQGIMYTLTVRRGRVVGWGAGRERTGGEAGGGGRGEREESEGWWCGWGGSGSPFHAAPLKSMAC